MTFCPCCGADQDAPERVIDGPFEYDGRGEFRICGEPLRASPQIIITLGTLISARGRVVGGEVIARRAGYEGDDTRNVVTTLASMCRRALRAVGAPSPIETVHGVGYRWRLP